ncbi:MAG: hypothetical protein IPP14_11250 [Planctomycetes bacterium]|nr:hypothetical protein [Planctomycetota bacterium]
MQRTASINLEPAAPWQTKVELSRQPYGTHYRPKLLKAPLWWRITRTSLVIGLGTFFLVLLSAPLAFG